MESRGAQPWMVARHPLQQGASLGSLQFGSRNNEALFTLVTPCSPPGHLKTMKIVKCLLDDTLLTYFRRRKSAGSQSRPTGMIHFGTAL